VETRLLVATIREGETVVDLGSGGGMDVFLSVPKVGPNGQVIGIDMNPDMVARARRSASQKNLHPPQVCFVQALLTQPLPIKDSSVDCILSNCVINLLPESGKRSVLKECWRVLKPGGRIVLDDIIAKKELPEELKNDMQKFVECISGAIQIDFYRGLLTESGFKDVNFVQLQADLNVYAQSKPTGGSSGCCGASGGCGTPRASTTPALEEPSFDINAYVASYQIYSVKAKDVAAVTQESSTALLQWWDAYPTPKSNVGNISVSEVISLLQSDKTEYAVIDVRRDDHAGGHVKGSFQHPAQTFYDELPAFFEKYSAMKQVIFYCQRSTGRGTRCAKWYQDYLEEHRTGSASQVLIMTGGIRAWLDALSKNDQLIGYD
ncbi:S-adenosyl-L-methionine-dependent methyltransferase, partial [Gymnopus androsaceus JB14]